MVITQHQTFVAIFYDFAIWCYQCLWWMNSSLEFKKKKKHAPVTLRTFMSTCCPVGGHSWRNQPKSSDRGGKEIIERERRRWEHVQAKRLGRNGCARFCYGGGITINMWQTHSLVAGFWLLGLVERCWRGRFDFVHALYPVLLYAWAVFKCRRQLSKELGYSAHSILARQRTPSKGDSQGGPFVCSLQESWSALVELWKLATLCCWWQGLMTTLLLVCVFCSWDEKFLFVMLGEKWFYPWTCCFIRHNHVVESSAAWHCFATTTIYTLHSRHCTCAVQSTSVYSLQGPA